MRIEDRGENDNDGGLDQSFLHVWNTEQTLSAILLVDGFATNRLRFVRSIKELLSYFIVRSFPSRLEFEDRYYDLG